MPGNVEEIYELTIARLPTEPYDRTILSLLVRCLFIGREKHQHNIVHHYFHCFSLGWQTIWLLGLEEPLHDLSPRNEEKQYGRQIHPFSF